ncbi:sugar kinase [Pullulanibacillus camelliae]|uniref:Sugar kinase n=1 Tax=Pullulanibacillus camelliae TaxID=1707096 RepID=A0A8J3E0K6_9BACL|nr:PfkB family carbohydrate kinase [Pullulanibacillus camelliae]GGE54765.1 sugar kinase [Pullulanibacillus camelliae]
MNAQTVDNPRKKVLVMGSAILDVILTIPSLPKSGEDVFAKQEESFVGGCAYNVANILKRCGVNYDLMVPIGNGPNGKRIQEQLIEDNHSLIIKDNHEDNGWCLSIVEEGGERTFITMTGIENDWKPEWFEHIDIFAYDYIYLSGYTFEGHSASVVLEELKGKKKDAKIIFDPSPRARHLNKDFLQNLFQLNTIVHCNVSELAALTGTTEMKEGVSRLNSITSEPVIVTMGGDGTLYYAEEGFGECKEAPIIPVDTIGAGDAHMGGFIAGLVAGKSIREACCWGNVMARKIVQVRGGKLP